MRRSGPSPVDEDLDIQAETSLEEELMATTPARFPKRILCHRLLKQDSYPSTSSFRSQGGVSRARKRMRRLRPSFLRPRFHAAILWPKPASTIFPGQVFPARREMPHGRISRRSSDLNGSPATRFWSMETGRAACAAAATTSATRARAFLQDPMIPRRKTPSSWA